MEKFTIQANNYLRQNIQAYYHQYYTGYQNYGNPDYLNDLKNTFNSFSKENIDKLDEAIKKLRDVLKNDLSNFNISLTICIVPRSKAENTYSHNQLLFKKVIQELIKKLGFQDGSQYILRHTDTRTTHLSHSPRGAQYAGNGDMPYPGITNNTCNISSDVQGKDILLIDDIYTGGINIDEDAIQALIDNGANKVYFYSVAKTI